MLDLEVFVTEGLGDNSYLLASSGFAALIDAQRDADRFLKHAAARDLSVAHVLETHVHNDYVSGAVEVRAATGAEIAAPAEGGYAFTHRPMGDGDEVQVGDVRLVAMATPGHTPEHLSYLVLEGDAEAPAAVFTGGSLMVGGAGRTDLLGEDLAFQLTRAQYGSLRRLAALSDDVVVLPTHGAGSFCGAGRGPKERTSTLREERMRNGALRLAQEEDEEGFVKEQLSGLLAYPAYYRHMAPLNRAGVGLLDEIGPCPPLTPDEVARRVANGHWAVDGRPRLQFASGHLPESVNVELDDAFASYVGWVIPFNDPLVLVLPQPEEESLRRATTDLARIGYERVGGWLEGGVEAWEESGRMLRTYPTADVDALCRAYRAGEAGEILDVRQRSEWERSHIPGSRHLFVGDLPDRLGEVPRGEHVWAICATGHRSSMAASLLDRAGVPVTLVAIDGVPAFLQRCSPEEARAG